MNIRKWRPAIWLVVGFACLGAFAMPPSVKANAAPNALIEPNPNQPISGDIMHPGWDFSDLSMPVSELEPSMTTDPAATGPVLRIVSKGSAGKNVWWIQYASLNAPAYKLTLLAKGFASAPKGEHVIGFGCEFKDKDYKWISYVDGPRVAEFQAKWPTSAVPDVKEWKAFSMTITPPAGAAFIGIRLSLLGSSPCEGDFAQVKLVPAGKTGGL